MMMPSANAPPAYVAGPQPGQQQVVTVQPAPAPVNPQSHSSYWKGMQWTGIIQVALGSLTVILGIVTATVFTPVLYFGDIGSPIWCGILFYIVAGVLGIVSGCKKNSGVAIGYMVLSILACLAACCVVGFAASPMSFINTVNCRGYYRYRYDYITGGYSSYYDSPPTYCNFKAAINGIYATLIILAIAEFVVAIVGASMTCSPLCNGGRTTRTVIHYQTQPHVVVATLPQGPAFYNAPAGQPQVANPAQQNVYPQAQAPPTGEQQYQELTK